MYVLNADIHWQTNRWSISYDSFKPGLRLAFSLVMQQNLYAYTDSIVSISFIAATTELLLNTSISL
jgi:hypothetical protein